MTLQSLQKSDIVPRLDRVFGQIVLSAFEILDDRVASFSQNRKHELDVRAFELLE